MAGSSAAAAAFRRAVLAAAILCAAGCTSVASTEATFEGSSWRVTALNGQPVPATGYRLQFDDGHIGGRFGCNQFGGPYRVEGELLIAGDVASTLIGCPEPQATHEAQGFAVLGRPMQITWHSGQRLTLGNAAGSIALERNGPA